MKRADDMWQGHEQHPTEEEPSPAPLAPWGSQLATITRLQATVLVLALTSAALAGTTLWVLLRPLPVIYTAPGGAGVAWPGVVPEAQAAHFAQRLVLLLYNITPATAEAVHREVEAVLAAQFLVVFRAQAGQERARMQAEELSAQLSIQATEVAALEAGHLVTLTAVRRIYVGKLPVRDEPVTARVRLYPVPPSPLNPAGLLVLHLNVTPALTAKPSA